MSAYNIPQCEEEGLLKLFVLLDLERHLLVYVLLCFSKMTYFYLICPLGVFVVGAMHYAPRRSKPGSQCNALCLRWQTRSYFPA